MHIRGAADGDFYNGRKPTPSTIRNIPTSGFFPLGFVGGVFPGGRPMVADFFSFEGVRGEFGFLGFGQFFENLKIPFFSFLLFL